MAALTIAHDGYFFFNEAAQASSEVVGYENSHQRGIRYKFTIPTSRTAGATSYSFTKTNNGHGGGTSGLRWNYALSTNASAYLDTCAAGDGYASAAATFSGSKTGLKLLPGTVYYLFIYPGEEKLGWYYWNYPDSKMTFSVDGDITYSVSYNANGGSGAPSKQTKTHGTALTLSSTKPTKSDTNATGYKVTFDTQGGSSVSAITSSKITKYTFSKWNTNSGGTGTSYNSGASYTANADVTLYAQYTSSTSNGSITLPSAPTKSGYSFSGWYDAASGGNKIGNAGASYTPTKAITLYARWSATGYSITYTLNGGTVSGNPTSYTADTATFTLKNPTKNGYDFAGWTGSNGTTPQTSVSIAKGSTGNKSYTANWTPKTYSISYTLNSGTVSGNPTSYTIETATFTLKNPTRTNYTFTGWTGSNGTSPETTVTIEKGSTGDKSYTANWSQNVISYTISYNYDGGTAGPSAPTSANVDSYVQISNPTKSGYTFKGWTISGMNPTSSKKCYYGSSTTDSSNQSTTSTSLSGITATRFKNLRTSAGTVTFKATWEAISTTVTYTISYNYASGNKGTYAPTSGTVGSYVRISNPTRSGYTFNGWSISGMNPSSSKPCYYGDTQTDSSNTKKTSGTTLSNITSQYFKDLRNTSGTVTFTATWTEVPAEDNTYNITYSLGTGATAGSPAPTSGTKGTYINIANPTRTNYTFTGWNITGLDSGTHYHGTSKPTYGNYGATSVTGTSISGVKSTWFNLQATGTVTFTATWESTQTTTSYTISYNYDGGTKGTYAPTSANVGSYVQISNPTKSGYTFKGWSISGLSVSYTNPAYHGTTQTDSSNTKVTSGTTLSGITSTYFKNLRSSSGTVTFTATWEAVPEEDNEYSITYVLGTGGTAGNPAPTNGTKGTYINIANPTRANYEFNGWNITGLDSGTHYHGNSKPTWGDYGATSVSGTSISGVKSTWFKLQATGTVTFTATWTATSTATSYAISYNLDSGTAGTYAPTSGTVGEYVRISNPTKSGYTFTGWTISGINPSSTNPCYHGSTQTDSSNTRVTSGTSLSRITSEYFKNLRNTSGTVTFTATWESTQTTTSYTIAYSLGGGQAGTYAPTSADVGSYVQISNPTRTNYTFAGWNITGMNPTSTDKCYYGNYTTDTGNQSTTATSLSGITATRFKNLRTSAGTVTFTAVWEDRELTGLILRPVSDTTLGHTCSSGTSGYSMISETASDDDTTYIAQQITQTTDQTATSTFKLSATMPSGEFKITGATIKVRGKSASNSTYSGTYQLSTDASASAITLSETAYESTFDSNVCSSLIGNTYTSSTFPEISVTITTTGKMNQNKAGQANPEIRITQVYLQLEYEAIVDNTYDIIYTLNGGTAGSPAPSSGTKGTYVNIANPTRSGYTFTGWNITGLDSGTHYHGNSRPMYGNTGATSVNGTSINGVKSTWFSLQATQIVTFTANWEIIETDDELTGLILRPVSDTTLGHTCSSGTSGYSMISETASDDDTTYIAQQITQTTDQTATSTFKLGGTLPDGVFKITDATIKVRGKSASNGTYSGTYQLSTDSATSAITLSETAYTSTTNSNVCDSLIGNMYTKNNFPEISVTITTTGKISQNKAGQAAPEIRITQVYLQLEYEPVIGLAKIYTQNAWHNALSYIFINGAWKMVQAHARKNSNWKPGQGS